VENSLLHNWIYCELSHEDLIKQYQETLDSVIKKRNEIKSEINNIKEILEEIKLAGQSKRLSKKRKTDFIEKWQELEAVDTHYSGIQGDLEHSLSWMKNGHAPGVTRGIERRAAYEREKPFDPLVMQRFFRSQENEYSWDTQEKEMVLGLDEKTFIDNALSLLTDREKEIYVMAKGNYMSYGKIAKLLNVSKSTVSANIYRAEKKIGKYVAAEKGRVSI